ncbi:DUF4326 domain-containing protein [Catenulispora acidiphila]|uniref:DUF4326 domain-containing protein n=1 Tax=Catenulispora acidiphila TaxID=304895 RepID=UPI00019E3795|nr:DUF4326 domain-containing protein [Catenulispora acidiphila]
MPELPRRIQLSRQKGWRKPEGAVVVSRPGPWGNPFSVTKGSVGWYIYEPLSRQQFDELGSLTTRAEAQELAVHLYGAWLKGDLFAVELELRRRRILEHLPALAGKDLCCWCAPGTACHVDVLLPLVAERCGTGPAADPQRSTQT